MKWNKYLLIDEDVSWKRLTCLLWIFMFSRQSKWCAAQLVPRQNVVLQIVMPQQAMAENKYQSAHLVTKETIKHGREVIYRNLRDQFNIDSWLNFTITSSPSEVLSLFCNQIFNRNVNTIVALNHGPVRASTNSYILQLADTLGYPVISWDPHYPGALQVSG